MPKAISIAIAIPKSVLTLKARLAPPGASYIRSYPHLVRSIKDRPIGPAEFVSIAHMVYGWMPTVLRLHASDPALPFEAEAAVAEKARQGGSFLDATDLKLLMTATNASIIGTSKLLHFINPDQYPIWDTKIFAFIRHGAIATPVTRPVHGVVNSVDKYERYCDAARQFVAQPRFQRLHRRVNKQLPAPVGALRALELVMFTNAPPFIQAQRNASDVE